MEDNSAEIASLFLFWSIVFWGGYSVFCLFFGQGLLFLWFVVWCVFSCNAGVYAFRCSAVLYQCDYCASEKKEPHEEKGRDNEVKRYTACG